jgi:hypothetical protein
LLLSNSGRNVHIQFVETPYAKEFVEAFNNILICHLNFDKRLSISPVVFTLGHADVALSFNNARCPSSAI